MFHITYVCSSSTFSAYQKKKYSSLFLSGILWFQQKKSMCIVLTFFNIFRTLRKQNQINLVMLYCIHDAPDNFLFYSVQHLQVFSCSFLHNIQRLAFKADCKKCPYTASIPSRVVSVLRHWQTGVNDGK